MSEKEFRLQRRNAKAKLTRLVKGMELLIAQGRPVHEVNESYSKVNEAYETVQTKHDQLVSEIENEDEFLRQEQWMEECQENFIKITINQKDYCNQRESNIETHAPDSGIPENNSPGPAVTTPAGSIPDPALDSLAQPDIPLPTPGSNAPHLFSSLYGIPKPSLPMFSGGREKDFAMLKMALDSLIGVHPSLTEQYKYQVLLGRLGGNARKLAESFMHETNPYSCANQALMEKYGQPRQLVQSELGRIMQTPAIKPSDYDGFENFALTVNSLVGMLKSLEGENGFELKCGSHVDRLISKLPPSYRDRFVEFCITNNILEPNSDKTYNLIHLAEWLQVKARALRISHQASDLYRESTQPRMARSRNQPSTSSYLVKERTKAFCPYCNGTDHYLGGCVEFRKFSSDEIIQWIKSDKRCYRCGRTHHPDKCTLRRPCNNCKDLHLTVLHDAIQKGADKPTPSVNLYIDTDPRPHNVMLKIVPVRLYGPNRCLDTYAVLDDGSMRSIILDEAVDKLDLAGERDEILLTTVRQEPTQCVGRTLTVEISAANQPNKRYQIQGAFTSPLLRLSDYSYPTQSLQSCWAHLRGLKLPDVCNARPLILVGSDNANLILPQEPVILGPSGSPAAVRTKLGWTLQGPSSLVKSKNESCNFITTTQTNKHMRDVQRLWQVDILPYRQAVRSKQDQKALEVLEERTIRVDVDCVLRYATPLLRLKDDTQFNVDQRSTHPNLKGTEKHLQSKPEVAEMHNKQIYQLVEAGFVKKISETEANIHVSFVMARSRVAPKRQPSLPRLELCTALSGAELAALLLKELSFPIESTHFWSDSTTVLRWLESESCRYKVFVGTWISEIQTITNVRVELKKTFCGAVETPTLPDPKKFDQLVDLITSTKESQDGAANVSQTSHLTADDVGKTEHMLYRQIQKDCFPEDFNMTISIGRNGERRLEVFTDADGRVRRARVKVDGHYNTRPVVKVVQLPELKDN